MGTNATYTIASSDEAKSNRSVIYYLDNKGFTEEVTTTNLIYLSHQIGTSYQLEYIKDYDGNLHANSDSVSDELKSSYKYHGNLDVNNDGIEEAIYTNKISGRWVTAEIDTITGEIDYSDHGENGSTRVVGIYDDPLIAVGLANGGYLDDGVTPAPAQFGATGLIDIWI